MVADHGDDAAADRPAPDGRAAPDGATELGRAFGYAAVLGDVVGSREADPAVFDRLREALDRTNRTIPGLQPLQMTIGDEFQGVYPRLGDALNATLLVRLLLHEVVEVRFGLGWGDITRWNPRRAPFEQDGPAWWSARDALEAADAQERGAGMPAGWRTALRFAADARPSGADAGSDGGSDGPAAASASRLEPARHLDVAVDASLEGLVMLRDQVLSRLDERDVGLVLALLDGENVTDAAGRVGISQQAASRRLRSNGGYALVRSWTLLEGDG